MGDPFEEEVEVPPFLLEAPLPSSVEAMLRKICSEQCQEPPDVGIRRRLGSIGEQGSLTILRIISSRPIRKTLSAFLVYLMDRYPDCLSSSPFASPQKRTSPSLLPTPESKRVQGESSTKPKPKIGSSPCVQFASPHRVVRQLSFRDEPSPESNCRTPPPNISQQLMILSELEFRKLFLVLSYIGSKTLEDVISPKIADDIVRKKTLPMTDFESEIWNAFGKACYAESDRSKYLDWDCGKTHLYYCHIKQNGYCTFKGPYLNTTRTHLQRALGDENVLIVKFVEDACCANIIVEEGILVGFRRYRFFVYKDDKERKKTPAIMKTKTASLKCYFVRFESIETYNHGGSYVFAAKRTSEARCHFMHVHMVSNMAKYAARLSLILSKTIKLQVNLASVTIERVEDILCRDESGCIICDEDGEPRIHTDGTGFISEDLAMRCPKDFSKAEYIKDENYENFVDIVDLEDMIAERRGNGSLNKEPPLLMQCRLFKNGCAVKGTFLVNRKIGSRKIQIRPSMVKVETDPTISALPTFNSLEVVAISHRPRKTYLSKHLISLLSYGGVGNEFFMEILGSALEETKQVYLKKRAALKVAINYREMDDDCLAARLISSGVPLNEPHLHARLSRLAKIERSKLRGGKLPLSDSFYLMGTADPTGVLENNEVCVILDSGQVSGRVLVYRNPGLHFGDVHVMKARYVEELVDIVGDAKYGIFFSTKGPRSAASEIANGDFDGDMYWVSINRKLVDSYRASKPWTRMHSTPKAVSKKPTEFSADELEYELFRQFLGAKSKGASMSVAADSWLAFMDLLLMLRDDDVDGMHSLKGKILHLIDIYYDALDAPKSGKKVSIPHDLKANRFPHYMERGNPFSYHSTSILGQIYDYVDSYPDEDLCITEISKLPCFDVEIPDECMALWGERYEEYKKDMTMAMNSGCEVKNSACNEVIKKYKKLLYGAPEFEQSVRKTKDIFNEALALYHVTYDNARITYSIEKCGFAWKVAGSALCRIHAMYHKENAFPILPSILQDIL
ncbi:probable RNA-dependent RNA polymerase 3 isoform X1 [Nicotiana tomentosiformis]|uniref:probable RNA-dependent RNA polymerase 3 isoform X1 n=1 Tax=Nicotiana tomentosiformis TaxID=4098 RepID=UPI00051B0CE3|nr:probable RNA-dependent RNA polymerase 3 isoform X1 [Nicotiana tomentosiformis]